MWGNNGSKGQIQTEQALLYRYIYGKTTAAFILYSAWNVWKERNHRNFEGSTRTPAQVFAPEREEIGLRRQACGHPWID
jgi:hypothetical protein